MLLNVDAGISRVESTRFRARKREKERGRERERLQFKKKKRKKVSDEKGRRVEILRELTKEKREKKRCICVGSCGVELMRILIFIDV